MIETRAYSNSSQVLVEVEDLSCECDLRIDWCRSEHAFDSFEDSKKQHFTLTGLRDSTLHPRLTKLHEKVVKLSQLEDIFKEGIAQRDGDLCRKAVRIRDDLLRSKDVDNDFCSDFDNKANEVSVLSV